MKTIKIQIIVLLFLFSLAVKGQETITINGAKFITPLIEKWATEYSKENPNVKIEFLSKSDNSKQADINVLTYKLLAGQTDKNQIVYVNKYALLPITGESNTYIKSIKKRGLNKDEIKDLFFGSDELEKSKEKDKHVTIYSGVAPSSSSQVFANYFGYQPSEIIGKRILGDDIYLLSAIKKDSTGVTFNNLSNIYDIKTRKVKDGITILPLNIDKGAFSAIASTIDEALAILEKNKFETIPTENVGFFVDKKSKDPEIIKFLSWVISEGQKYNHEFGFLNIEKESQAYQIENLNEKLLAIKY